MRQCSRCGGGVESRFRFCPWCAAPLRLKLVELFRPHPGIARDRGRALRVSAYLDADAERHVRFSVWSETGEAECAISLDAEEAARLSSFIGEVSASLEADELEATQPIGRRGP